MTRSRVVLWAASDYWQAAQIILNIRIQPNGPTDAPRWWTYPNPTTSCTCLRVSCSAACKLVRTPLSRASFGWLSCSARAARCRKLSCIQRSIRAGSQLDRAWPHMAGPLSRAGCCRMLANVTRICSVRGCGVRLVYARGWCTCCMCVGGVVHVPCRLCGGRRSGYLVREQGRVWEALESGVAVVRWGGLQVLQGKQGEGSHRG